jgi:hypothetical protein
LEGLIATMWIESALVLVACSSGRASEPITRMKMGLLPSSTGTYSACACSIWNRGAAAARRTGCVAPMADPATHATASATSSAMRRRTG